MPFSPYFTHAKLAPRFLIQFTEGWGWSRRSPEGESWENMKSFEGEIQLVPKEWIWNYGDIVGFWADVEADFQGHRYTEVMCLLHTSEVMEVKPAFRPSSPKHYRGFPTVFIFTNQRFSFVPSDFHPSGYMADWPTARGLKGFCHIYDVSTPAPPPSQG